MRTGFRFLLAALTLISVGCSGSASSGSSGSSTAAAAASPETPGSTSSSFSVTSTGFTEGGTLPKTFADSSCGGEDHSPALSWTNAPSATKSFAISVIDLDFNNTIHGLLVNIPVSTTSIPQDVQATSLAATWVLNYAELNKYSGPCPPMGEPHRYQFKVYALNLASISQTSGSASSVLTAINAATIGSATLTASYTTP